MSTEPASASGAAYDVTADIGPTDPSYDATQAVRALAAARAVVVAAEAKVNRQGVHLAGARQALAAAQAELNTLEG